MKKSTARAIKSATRTVLVMCLYVVVAELSQSNMNLVISLCFIVVAVGAAPPRTTNSNDNVELLRYSNDAQTDGTYSFNFEQSDGQKREEQGGLKKASLNNQSLSVKGSYQWVGPDGVQYNIIYVADENGYKPEIQQGPGGSIPASVLASMVG